MPTDRMGLEPLPEPSVYEQARMEEDDADRDLWTLKKVREGNIAVEGCENAMPPPASYVRLVKEYHETWFRTEPQWWDVRCTILKMLVPGDTVPINWDYIKSRVTKERLVLLQLCAWRDAMQLQGFPEVSGRLVAVERAMNTAHRYCRQTVYAMWYLSSEFTAHDSEHCLRPPEHKEYDEDDNPITADSIENPDKTRMNSFQKTFVALRMALFQSNFRRANGIFFVRKETRSGILTDAYEESQSVEEFIRQNTAHGEAYEVWQIATKSGATLPQLVQYMTDFPLLEVQDLEENTHLRSFEGDAHGRGAVVYDCMLDMAWPYQLKKEWAKMAARVNVLRGRLWQRCSSDVGAGAATAAVTATTTHAPATCAVTAARREDVARETEERRISWLKEKPDAPPQQLPAPRGPPPRRRARTPACQTGWHAKVATLECKQPSDKDVCVLHMDCAFPHDTLAELEEVMETPLHLRWRECIYSECEFAGRRNANKVHNEELQKLLYGKWQRDSVKWDAETWGHAWIEAPPNAALDEEEMRQVYCSGAFMQGLMSHDMACVTQNERMRYVTDDELATHVFDENKQPVVIIEEHMYIRNGERYFVPLCTPVRRTRYELDAAEWDETKLNASEKICTESFVRVQSFLGQTWQLEQRERAPPEADVLVSTPLSNLLDEKYAVAETVHVNHGGAEVAETFAVVHVCTDKDPKKDMDMYQFLTKMGIPYMTGQERRNEDGTTTHWKELTIRKETRVRGRDGKSWYKPFWNEETDEYKYAYFRVDTGRTWLDCDTPEINKIYDTQMFTDADKHMLFACKGRTLFQVGELDKYEMTLFYQGVGGCGKSTAMKQQQAFWPAHLRGILSSNIEPKFGMSQVLQNGKTRAIFCNEVSEDLKLDQTEWQTSVSGEQGSYAVKNAKPLVCTVLAQHMWCGNTFPVHFRNKQSQVSRRLAGVLMNKAVKERDNSIGERMSKSAGTLLRKEVLAYRDFLQQWGTTDPMSKVDRLPPAFAEFYRASQRKNNPFLEFLENGLSKYFHKSDSLWTSEIFMKRAYKHYQKDNNERVGRWGTELYMSACTEKGITTLPAPATRKDEWENTHDNGFLQFYNLVADPGMVDLLKDAV